MRGLTYVCGIHATYLYMKYLRWGALYTCTLRTSHPPVPFAYHKYKCMQVSTSTPINKAIYLRRDIC